MEVQRARLQQDLDLAGEAAAVARSKVAEVAAAVEGLQAGQSNELGEEAGAGGRWAAVVLCSEGQEAAAVVAGQEPTEYNSELVEAAGVVGVRLVRALFALEAAEAVEALPVRSQRAEGVVGALEGRLLLMVADLPLLLVTEIGARRGAGADLFFGLVVEAAWSSCPVEWGRAVGTSLMLQISCHLSYLARCSHPGSFAQSPS